MKLQMKFSRIICLSTVIISSINFIFCLGILTDVYNFYYLIDYGIDGMDLYLNMQPFNQLIVRLCIVMILVSLSLLITQTNSRRKYYLSNYVSTLLATTTNIIICIYGIIKLSQYKSYFLNEVDFELYKSFAETFSVNYVESTFWFDINIVFFIINIFISLLLVGNLVWKTKLMRLEDKALKLGELHECK